MCGLRAPELPIDVAPRIGKARMVVGQRHSAVQTIVKSESIILMSRGELVWMEFKKLMSIFCWEAVSMFYSIHAYPCPVLSRLSLSLEVFGSVKTECQPFGYTQCLCISEVGHRNAEEEVKYHSTPLLRGLTVI
jgi:hypothetical protein